MTSEDGAGLERLVKTRDVIIPTKLEKRFGGNGNGDYVRTGFYTEGKTRMCYSSVWVPSTELVPPEVLAVMEPNRIFKVDKAPEGERACRYVASGCTTINDARVLTRIMAQLKRPEEHHINRIHGFGEIELDDGSYHVSVEEFFPSQTAMEYVEEHGPLSKQDFEKVFGQMLDAERYMISEMGILHRDPKPSNWLIGEDLEVRLTDFANAADMGSSEASFYPTAGSHYHMAPTLIGRLTGKPTVYTEWDERYALGVLGLYLLRGKYDIEYYPDEPLFGRRLDTGDTILVPDGNGGFTYSVEKHNATIETAIGKLPFWTRRKYGNMFRGLLFLEEKE